MNIKDCMKIKISNKIDLLENVSSIQNLSGNTQEMRCALLDPANEWNFLYGVPDVFITCCEYDGWQTLPPYRACARDCQYHFLYVLIERVLPKQQDSQALLLRL